MSAVELRDLAARANAEAVQQANYAASNVSFEQAMEQAEMANRLFLMARNLNERAAEKDVIEARLGGQA